MSHRRRRWAPNHCITCIVVFSSYFWMCGSRVVQMSGTGLYVSYLIFIHLYIITVSWFEKKNLNHATASFYYVFVRWIYFCGLFDYSIMPWRDYSIMPWRESSRMVIPSIRVSIRHGGGSWPQILIEVQPSHPPPCCFTSTGVKEL